MRACVSALVSGPLLIVLAALAILDPTAEAQQAGKVPRIGFLYQTERRETTENRWRDALRQYGYVDGQNIVRLFVWADERFERLPELAAELVRANVNIIVATRAQTARVAQRATTTIPIVTMTADITGLAASVARPGGNVTGVMVLLSEQGGKRLQLMKEIVPNLSSVAVVANMAGTGPIQMKSVEDAARTFRITTHVFDLRAQEDVDAVVAAAVAKRVRGLIVLQDPVMFRAAPRLAEAALRHRLPASHAYREFVDAGGLFSYGVSLWDVHLLAVGFIDRILKGANPADLPMEEPTKFELVINRRTAQALGLAIPPSLLLRADQIIE